MSSQTKSLNNIHIVSPCSMDWDAMTGNEQVRFCEHCNLHVNNLSEMTRRDAMRLVRRSKGQLCVRYYQRPDGSIQTLSPRANLHEIKRRVSTLAAGAFTAALSLSASVAAQTPQSISQLVPGKVGITTPKERAALDAQGGVNASLAGTVLDPNGAVIPGAKVTLINEKSKQEQVITSNDNGEYRFQSIEAGIYTLKIESIGFATKEQANIDLQVSGEQRIDTTLELGATSVMVGAIGFIEPNDPLVKAAFKDDIAAVRQLIASGVDVNAIDKDADTTALMQAVEHGNGEMVQTLLGAGADINLKNKSGQTALMHLGEHSTEKMVWDLVAAGAKLNQRDDEGNSALMNVAAVDNKDVLQALLEAGAKVNAKNKEGETALMVAAGDGLAGNVKVLIEAGADINKKDKDGSTALARAKDSENAEVIEILKEYGAVE